jgi:hypothetical protein
MGSGPASRPSPMKAICKPNCKPTTRHRTVSGITGRHRHGKIGKLERTFSYQTSRTGTRIIELENRCTGNRTVGSNPTPDLSQPPEENPDLSQPNLSQPAKAV